MKLTASRIAISVGSRSIELVREAIHFREPIEYERSIEGIAIGPHGKEPRSRSTDFAASAIPRMTGMQTSRVTRLHRCCRWWSVPCATMMSPASVSFFDAGIKSIGLLLVHVERQRCNRSLCQIPSRFFQVFPKPAINKTHRWCFNSREPEFFQFLSR